MRINELLDDKKLLDLWALVNITIWERLTNKDTTDDIAEGYAYRRQAPRRRIVMPARIGPARAIIRRPLTPKVPVKPFPTRPELNPVKKPALSVKTNPKTYPLKGHNARLDQYNVFPEFSDKDIAIEMRSRNNGRKY